VNDCGDIVEENEAGESEAQPLCAYAVLVEVCWEV
jgi:hypothetical protein